MLYVYYALYSYFFVVIVVHMYDLPFKLGMVQNILPSLSQICYTWVLSALVKLHLFSLSPGTERKERISFSYRIASQALYLHPVLVAAVSASLIPFSPFFHY